MKLYRIKLSQLNVPLGADPKKTMFEIRSANDVAAVWSAFNKIKEMFPSVSIVDWQIDNIESAQIKK